MNSSDTKELLRTSQVLEVYALLQRGELTIEEACDQVGINYKTYTRHAERALIPIRAEIEDQRKLIVSSLTEARTKYLADMIAVATNAPTGKDKDGNPTAPDLAWRDRLAVIGVLESIFTQALDAEPVAEGAAAEYIKNEKTKLLSGPKTTKFTLPSGTEVEITETPPAVVENVSPEHDEHLS